jgi:peptidoglycan/LPS O-acetylase OafA/YrhL
VSAPPRFASLDGLRCLAIVPVIWHHATPHPLDGVLGRGPLGVDLFFVISGFLITTLLLREQERTGTVALGAFYLRRSLRIFPLYYAVLGAFVLHALLVREHGPVRDHFLRSVPTYATYTSNWFTDFEVPHAVVFSFAWSLATEEQFYLVWPWVIVAAGALGRRRQGDQRQGAALALPALFMVTLVLLDQATERGWLAAVVPLGALATRMLRSISTPIGLGALLALGLRWPRTRAALTAILGRRASAPLAFGGLALIAIEGWPLLHAHLAMIALVGACVIRPDHGLRGPLELRPIAHVGVVSYGLYLVNVPVIVATRRALGPANESTLLVFGVGLAASVAVATLTYHLLEAPFFRLRDRFRPSA